MPGKNEFKLKTPLPKYRTTETLVKNLIEYVTNGNFEVGDKFLSDRDLVIITGRSRTSVRRALNRLQDEGWIIRHGGKGTYVGDRLAEFKKNTSIVSEGGMSPGVDADKTYHALPTRKIFDPQVFEMNQKSTADSTIRIAVVVSTVVSALASFATQRHSWYHDEILDGIDEEAAIRKNIVVEFLGVHGMRTESLLPRLQRSCPDVFLCIGPPLSHASVIGVAKQWNIPCVLAAVRAPELGFPNFYEDSVSAARDAVKYFAGRGHERIGFAQVMNPSGWWAFDRYEGYLQGMREMDLEKAVGEGLWLPLLPTRDSINMLRRYIKRNKITALLSGSYWVIGHLAELIHKQDINIPEDISLISFDQNPIIKHLLGEMDVTTINLPWRDLGKAFVNMVQSIINREEIPNMAFPCTLSEGDSVRNI